MLQMLHAMIVDDQVMLRDSLRVAIESQGDMQVVSVLSDASAAPAEVDRARPDLVLMDVCTENDHSGIIATKKIKKSHPEVRVLIMTGLPEITFVRQARDAGADGFVYKNISTADLISVIHSIMDGYSTFPSEKSQAAANGGLTDEEIEILRLACEAKSRKEIANELHLSEGTVKRRISEILAKTGYDSILRLAVDYVAKGYIVPRMSDE